MNGKVLVREERAADVAAIEKVTVAVFKTLAISGHTEQCIIAALRAGNALTVSLVAELEGARDRTYRLLSGDHIRRFTELVRPRACVCIARIQAARDWRRVDKGSAVASEGP